MATSMVMKFGMSNAEWVGQVGWSQSSMATSMIMKFGMSYAVSAR